MYRRPQDFALRSPLPSSATSLLPVAGTKGAPVLVGGREASWRPQSQAGFWSCASRVISSRSLRRFRSRNSRYFCRSENRTRRCLPEVWNGIAPDSSKDTAWGRLTLSRSAASCVVSPLWDRNDGDRVAASHLVENLNQQAQRSGGNGDVVRPTDNANPCAFPPADTGPGPGPPSPC